jgi:apolipoprotein N-acyltransferase
MDWNEIQNFSSNIVFGILLFAMIAYWTNLSLFNDSDILAKIGRVSTLLLMEFYFLFFVLVGL